MGHTLNAPHLPKEKPERLGYAVLIPVALSLLVVLLSRPEPEKETGKPITEGDLTEQSAVVLQQF